MRALFVIAVIAILIAGFGATLLSFPPAQGIAESIKNHTSDSSHALRTAEPPIQKIHDMSVVFSGDD
jgi:hypothetical protein